MCGRLEGLPPSQPCAGEFTTHTTETSVPPCYYTLCLSILTRGVLAVVLLSITCCVGYIHIRIARFCFPHGWEAGGFGPPTLP